MPQPHAGVTSTVCPSCARAGRNQDAERKTIARIARQIERYLLVARKVGVVDVTVNVLEDWVDGLKID